MNSRGEATRVHEEGFYAEHDIELLTGVTVTAIDPAEKRSCAQTDDKRIRLRPAADRHRRRAAQDRHPRRRSRRCPLPPHARRLRRAPWPPRGRRPGGGHRRGLDRRGVRRLSTPARPRRHRDRACRRAAGAGARSGARRLLPRRARDPRRRDADADRGRSVRGGGVGRGSPDQRRAVDRVRLRRRRRRRDPAHAARCRGRREDRERDRRQPAATNHACPTYLPPATSPTPGIRSTGGASVSSIGPTRSTRARQRPGRCSTRTSPTTGSRTSSPTSTTSAWNTAATPPSGTRSSTAGPMSDGEFIAFWLKDQRVIAGMNVNVWDVN